MDSRRWCWSRDLADAARRATLPGAVRAVGWRSCTAACGAGNGSIPGAASRAAGRTSWWARAPPSLPPAPPGHPGRGRGARSLVQAGRHPPVSRPGRRHHASEIAGRAGDSGVGHPVPGELRAGAGRAVRAGAAAGADRGPTLPRVEIVDLRRVDGGERLLSPPLCDAITERLARASSRCSFQPARLLHAAALRGVRWHAGLPSLQHLAHVSRRPRSTLLPHLQLRTAPAGTVPGMPRDPAAVPGVRDPAARGPRAGAVPQGAGDRMDRDTTGNCVPPSGFSTA